MFLCSNICNNYQQEPQIIVNNLHTILNLPKNTQTQTSSTVMIKKSKYLEYLQTCKTTNTPFTDEQFPPNTNSLNFKIPGRAITWKRITDIIKDPLMVQNNIEPADIQQGNIGDCYFLASISALAEVPARIENIFLDNFQLNGYGIYKLVLNFQGALTQVVIDDLIPVFATTDRPVFCKPKGKEIWVMLIEKAWAKIKGSYGNISSGCPHEVLNTFSVAPCFYFQIHEQMGPDLSEIVWEELLKACELNLPICAGSKPNVSLNGIKPQHTYTILDCGNVPSGGRNHKIIRMRNPWANTEYTGYASQSDTKFWSQAPPESRQKLIPTSGRDDGDFSIPFSEFVKNFESVDVCMTRPNFSYQFQTVKMQKNEPLFIRLQVYQQHEAYLTVQKSFNTQYGKQQSKYLSNYGHTRMIIAHQVDNSNYQYYCSKLQTNFPDLSLICPKLNPGNYLIMIQADFPQPQFTAVFSYYFSNLKSANQKNYQVIKSTPHEKYTRFMQSVFKNHALRVNANKIRIGPKPEDWIKTHLMYEEGGYGYVACQLESSTSIKLQITIDKNAIEANGFKLIGDYFPQETIEAGQQRLVLFSCSLGSRTVQNITFPPAGFAISRIV